MRRFNPEKELRKIQRGNKNKIIFGVLALLLIIAIGSSYALYQVRYSKRIIYTKVGDFSRDINILAVYVDDDKINDFPPKEDEVVYDRIDCDNNKDNHVTAYWDYEKWGLVVETTKKAKCNVYFKTIKVNDAIEYAYNGTDGSNGTIQTFIVPKTGRYKLEVWGAQGGIYTIEKGAIPGYGGYSVGEVTLTKGQKLYIGIGGEGYCVYPTLRGGYNGGGDGICNGNQCGCGGGGATHIVTITGLLSTLSSAKESVLIVAGGGGGFGDSNSFPADMNTHGGGIKGNDGINLISSSAGAYHGFGGTQTAAGQCSIVDGGYSLGYCGTFGQGGSRTLGDYGIGGAGGGGGFYGGSYATRAHAGAGGGSGYIGNILLSNKVMYCYNCTTSTDIDTKTNSTTNVSEDSISMYAKKGNGAARITYLGAN